MRFAFSTSGAAVCAQHTWKSMSRKTCDFSQIFVQKMFCCASADINFALVFTVFFACRTLFFVSLFACILDPKNLSKKLPKRASNPVKIDVENVVFLDIDFFVFWHRFWKVLALQDGVNLAPNSIFEFIRLPSLTFLSERSFKNGVVEGSKHDFGSPGPRFERIPGRFFEILALLAEEI